MPLKHWSILPLAHRFTARRIPGECVSYSSATRGTSEPTKESSKTTTDDDRKASLANREDSALGRRFAELSESALLASPSKARELSTNPETANAFTEELKAQLASRLTDASFSSEHAQAISISKIPSSAPKHARDIAAAPIWTGTESTEDAVLRMLVDAHKPLRGGKPKPQTINIPHDLRPPSTLAPKRSVGSRLESAREKSMMYAVAGDTPEEREKTRELIRERFRGPSMSAASVSALMSLADQRIEDARARGQFKDLPRGKPLEHDHNASSPYIDTTEYFLNKMIQRQAVLPPWVEKQQEIVAELKRFRAHLQADLLRFEAREIASAGGDLETQCRRAADFAKGEARLAAIAAREKALAKGETEIPEVPDGPTAVFRSQEFEQRERSYLELQMKRLNELTRSYNIIAPELAKKTYLRLDREIERCYREVAGKVEAEIRRRAAAPPKKLGTLGSSWVEKSVFYEKEGPKYGFKELWKDWFGKR